MGYKIYVHILNILEANKMKGATMISVNILWPDKLKEEVKKISKKQNTNFSYFVREATKEHLNRVKKEILEKELIEQCKETAKLNLEICYDFKYVDGENL